MEEVAVAVIAAFSAVTVAAITFVGNLFQHHRQNNKIGNVSDEIGAVTYELEDNGHKNFRSDVKAMAARQELILDNMKNMQSDIRELRKIVVEHITKD